MPARYRVTARQFAQLARSAPRRYEAAIVRGLQRGGVLGLRLLKRNISEGDVVDTGELRNSCEFDKKALLLGVTAPHGAFMEVGTRPHMPPVEPIVEWVKRKFSPNRRKRGKRRKGVTARKKGRGEAPSEANRLVGAMVRGALKTKKPELTDRQARAIAWRIAMTIKKKGTKPRWYMRKTVGELKPLILPEIRKAMLKADKRASRRAAAKTETKELGILRNAL